VRRPASLLVAEDGYRDAAHRPQLPRFNARFAMASAERLAFSCKRPPERSEEGRLSAATSEFGSARRQVLPCSGLAHLGHLPGPALKLTTGPCPRSETPGSAMTAALGEANKAAKNYSPGLLLPSAIPAYGLRPESGGELPRWRRTGVMWEGEAPFPSRANMARKHASRGRRAGDARTAAA
jgi:hypothetical protein